MTNDIILVGDSWDDWEPSPHACLRHFNRSGGLGSDFECDNMFIKNKDICAICLNEIILRPIDKCNYARIDCCRHLYHYNCIKEASKHRNLCPLCKYPFDAIFKRNGKKIDYDELDEFMYGSDNYFYGDDDNDDFDFDDESDSDDEQGNLNNFLVAGGAGAGAGGLHAQIMESYALSLQLEYFYRRNESD